VSGQNTGRPETRSVFSVRDHVYIVLNDSLDRSR
jgi:hypothetical protein